MSSQETRTSMFVHSKLDDADLDPYEFRIYGRIVRRGACRESIPNMADGCKMSPKRTRQAITSLLEKRLITKEERAGKTNIYRPTKREDWHLPESVPPSKNAGGTPGKSTRGKRSTPGKSSGGPPEDSQGVPLVKCGDEGNPIEGNPLKGVSVCERAGAREKPPAEEKTSLPTGLPASEIYRQVFQKPPGFYFAEKIDLEVGTDPPRLEAWRDACETWKRSTTENGRSYNPGNVRGMLNYFHEQLERERHGRSKEAKRDDEGPAGGSGDGAPTVGVDYDQFLVRAT